MYVYLCKVLIIHEMLELAIKKPLYSEKEAKNFSKLHFTRFLFGEGKTVVNQRGSLACFELSENINCLLSWSFQSISSISSFSFIQLRL